MRLRSIIIAALASAIGGLTVSMSISLTAFFAGGSAGHWFAELACSDCVMKSAGTPDPPALWGSLWFDQLGGLCAPQKAGEFRDAVIMRYLWHLEQEDLGAVKSYMAARSTLYRAELLHFQFEEGGQRTKRYTSMWGFPRHLLLLESPWPAERKFRDFEAVPFVQALDAKPETQVKVRVLWGGVLPSAVLFGLPIWCVWALWARSVPRAVALLSAAFTGALLLTVGIAWSAGSVRIGTRSEWHFDPASYAAAVSPIDAPPEETWDAFEGRRERGWTHAAETWDFSRVTLHDNGVKSRCPIRAHYWEGCGFPFIAFASDDPSPLGPAAMHEPSRIGEHAAPFDVAGLPPFWPGFLGNLAFWFAVIVACAKGPPLIRSAVRARRGECRACGHQLAGLARCPECGRS
jgi:hypothetical protein